jgi:hypothetical protein
MTIEGYWDDSKRPHGADCGSQHSRKLSLVDEDRSPQSTVAQSSPLPHYLSSALLELREG